MNYVIQTRSGNIIFITAEEFDKLKGEKNGLIYIKSQNRTINLNSVETITPLDVALEESKINDKKLDGKGRPLVYNNGEYLTVEGHFPTEILSPIEYRLRITKQLNKQLNV